jgi:hypothetical protein
MPKAQHAPSYRPVPPLLRDLRARAGLTQRELGARLRRPQSWVHSCETGGRRIDVGEFALWCRACGADPVKSFAKLAQEAR